MTNNFHILNQRDDGCDRFDGWTRVVTVKAPSDASERLVYDVFREIYGSHRCQHDYDCCGCKFPKVANW